jgi:arsenate reductase
MKKNAILVLVCYLLCHSCSNRDTIPFNHALMSYCESLPAEFANVPDSTGKMLREAGTYIIDHLDSGRETSISFVCEHNSRKSHLGQIWTQMAIQYYGIDSVKCYSGGTSPTYVNQRIIKALENAGFQISEKGIAGNGPKYYLDFGKPSGGFEIFSKRYDHPMNPDTNYMAITLCYNPEECCPITGGADEQLTIPYEDLQPYDNTPLETARYDEQCRNVARDMFYMMDFVKNNRDHGLVR